MNLRNTVLLIALGILMALILASCGGKNKADIGETVPGPPRDLVEKSLPDQMKSNTDNTGN